MRFGCISTFGDLSCNRSLERPWTTRTAQCDRIRIPRRDCNIHGRTARVPEGQVWKVSKVTPAHGRRGSGDFSAHGRGGLVGGALAQGTGLFLRSEASRLTKKAGLVFGRSRPRNHGLVTPPPDRPRGCPPQLGGLWPLEWAPVFESNNPPTDTVALPAPTVGLLTSTVGLQAPPTSPLPAKAGFFTFRYMGRSSVFLGTPKERASDA